MRRDRHLLRSDISEAVQEAIEEYEPPPNYQMIEETITSGVDFESFIESYISSSNPFTENVSYYGFAVWIHGFKENALVSLERCMIRYDISGAIKAFCAINLELNTFEEILEMRARNRQYTSSYDLALLLSDLHHKPGNRYMLSVSTYSMFIVDGEGEEERGESMPINILLRDIQNRLVAGAQQEDTTLLML